MTDMDDKDLDMRLAAYEAPEPSALLKARIMKAAQNTDPQTQTPKHRFTKHYMAIAASLVAVSAAGFVGLQLGGVSNPDIDEITAIAETATAFGFDDIYDWVESEDVPS